MAYNMRIVKLQLGSTLATGAARQRLLIGESLTSAATLKN